MEKLNVNLGFKREQYIKLQYNLENFINRKKDWKNLQGHYSWSSVYNVLIFIVRNIFKNSAICFGKNLKISLLSFIKQFQK